MSILLGLLFLTSIYNDKINTAEITRQELYLLESLDFLTLTNTEQRLTQLDADGNETAWLHLAKYHGERNPNTAYQLGTYFLKKQELYSAKLWFKVAIRQHHLDARIALATIYFELKQYSDIKELLFPIINYNEALAVLYRLALYQGDIAFINTYKSKLRESDNVDLYKELEQFSVFNSSFKQAKNIHPTLQTAVLPSNCLVDVQLFSTNLAGFRHAKALISAFENHNLSHYICLESPKYIPIQALNCQHEPSERINCNASVWLSRKDITSRYIGLIVEQGIAYVDNGIMYLDQADTLDVLVHELSHFIGFVDEYALPPQHQKCLQEQQTPFAHNLVVLAENYQGSRTTLRELILSQVPWRSLIKESTPILSPTDEGWTLATPNNFINEIGIFKADSCLKGNNTQAFKPIAQRTKFEYFELAFPEVYLNILQLEPKDYLMPSYHFNISRDLVKQGEFDKAMDVLQETLFN